MSGCALGSGVFVMCRPIAVDRPTAAQMLGVSEATLRTEQRTGRLRAKTTTINSDGRVTGKVLYLVKELERWVETLDDA
jgi:hypothetical protein